MRLNTEIAAAYLRDEGVVPADAEPTVESLDGGVSNGVVRVDWDDDAVVVKQPLPNLDVEDDWPADVERVHNEAAALRVYGDVVSECCVKGVMIPDVRFEDYDDHVIAIEAAPSPARVWKEDLLNGIVDELVAATVGEFLATAHEFAAADVALESTFGNYRPFEQLRLEPYHETVAGRHPDVAAPIQTEIERIRGTRSTLVHGDYSPKNVLVDESGAETQLWMLDFEVAHWGDPAFDLAFVLNHLFIKSMYVPAQRDEYVSAAETVWTNYLDNADVTALFESNVVTEIGVLMLARVDGKSPVEYVREAETKDRLRSLAKHTLNAETTTLEEFIAELRSEVDHG